MTPVPFLAVLAISGVAALHVEVAFVRALVLVLGNSSLAITSILVAFMLGFGAGSGLFAPFAGTTRERALRRFAALEIAAAFLGATAFFAARGLERADGLSPGALFALATAIAFVPAIPMGATYPCAVRVLRGRLRRASAEGAAFAAGTFGAVAGTLAAGFVTVALLGVSGAVGLAAALYLLNGAIAWRASRTADGAPESATAAAAPRRSAPSPGETPILAACAALGFASLALQVVWARILVFFAGVTTYALATVLALHLLGIAAGAAYESRSPVAPGEDRRRRVGRHLLAAAAATIAGHALLVLLPIAYPAEETMGVGATAAEFAARLFTSGFLLLGPATFFLGAALSAALAAVPHRAGLAYGIDSAASGAGALAAALVAIPLAGVERSLRLMAAILALGGLALSVRHRGAAVGIAAATVALLFLPLSPPLVTKSESLRGPAGGVVLESIDGPEGTVSVVEHAPETPDAAPSRALYIDGFLSAGTDPRFRYMRLLGHLPSLFARDAGSAVVICFGTGTTAGAVARHPFASVRIVELSGAVMRVAPHFSGVHGGVTSDPRVAVAIEDGRRFLRESKGPFDAVTLEPLVPYFPGAVHLYTREFYALGRERLSEAGVLCQWLPSHTQEPDELRSLVRSFTDVFPDGTLWNCDGTLVLLGGKGPLPELPESLAARLAIPAVGEDMAAIGLGGAAELLDARLLAGESLRRLAGDAPPVTDDRPFVEFFRLPKPPFLVNQLHALEAIRDLHEALRREGAGDAASPWRRERTRARLEADIETIRAAAASLAAGR